MNVINKKRLPMILVAAAVFLVSGIFFIAQRRYLAYETQITQRGRILTVKAGGDFQEALNSARGGDTIVLEAGAKFVGPFTLPNKGAGESYVTIQSSRTSELPEGVRVKPKREPKPESETEQSSLMPKLLSPGKGAAAVQTAPGAHHYRLIGLEIGRVAPDAVVWDLVKLGDGTNAQNSDSQVPRYLTIDRCYIHGDSGDLKRGISLQSADTEIINSHISDFHVRGQEAQAIAGWNGPGPYWIVNNYLEGAGENLIFGGSTGGLSNVVPSNIKILRNDFYKPTSWRGVWTVKNILELKNARRVVIDGNRFENCWLDAQQGYAILFTPRPSDSGATAVVEDVEFTNNIVRHVAAGIHLLGQDDLYAAGRRERRLHRVRIANNLFEDVNQAVWGGDGTFVKVVSGTDQVTIEHNTVLQTGNIIKSGGDPHRGFAFRDNIVRHNEYGAHGDDVGYGNPALSRYFPNAHFLNNLILKEVNAPANVENVYPAQNSFSESLSNVRFVNAASGNYRLSSGSRYKRKGTDGRDPGCDLDKLQAAMKGD